MMAEVEAFLADERALQDRSASGHLRAAHVDRIRRTLFGVGAFSVLREPVDRVVSDYAYARTRRHPAREAFARRYATLEAYVEERAEQDKTWRYVSPEDRPCDAEVIRETFRRYAFCGWTPALSTHVAFPSSLDGPPRPLTVRFNAAQPAGAGRPRLSRALRSRTEQANLRDGSFYAAVEEAISRKASDIAAFVAARQRSTARRAPVGVGAGGS